MTRHCCGHRLCPAPSLTGDPLPDPRELRRDELTGERSEAGAVDALFGAVS